MPAQELPRSKEVHRAPAPYAREESGNTNPALVQTEVELREKISREPESADLLYRLGLVLRLEGKPRPSLDTYTQAARHRVPTANELRSVALDYVLLNDYEDAIRWLERALKMEPGNVDCSTRWAAVTTRRIATWTPARSTSACWRSSPRT
jgi:tetratricopeptide (TPR) repeat protein